MALKLNGKNDRFPAQTSRPSQAPEASRRKLGSAGPVPWSIVNRDPGLRSCSVLSATEIASKGRCEIDAGPPIRIIVASLKLGVAVLFGT
jgi:hypothetical protein